MEAPFHGSRQQSAAEPRLRMGGASRFSVHTGGQLERRAIMVYAKLSTHCFRSTFNLARREVCLVACGVSFPVRDWIYEPFESYVTPDAPVREDDKGITCSTSKIFPSVDYGWFVSSSIARREPFEWSLLERIVGAAGLDEPAVIKEFQKHCQSSFRWSKGASVPTLRFSSVD